MMTLEASQNTLRPKASETVLPYTRPNAPTFTKINRAKSTYRT